MFYFPHEQTFVEDRCATENQAIIEFSHNVGAQYPEVCWLLTDWDTWVRNPFYVGKPVRHPEHDQELWEGYEAYRDAQPAVYDDVELPF